MKSEWRNTTSAYRKINEQRLLPRVQLETYNTLFSLGPSTAGEITQRLGEYQGNPSYHKRLAELEGKGCVTRNLGADADGKTVWVWDVNGQLPGPPPKRVKKVPSPDALTLSKCIIPLRKLYLDLKAKKCSEAEAIKILSLWAERASGRKTAEASSAPKPKPTTPEAKAVATIWSQVT